MFQVEMEGIVPVNLLLMANTISVVDPKGSLPKIYDLKGSYNNRIVAKGENQTNKDRNLMSCMQSRIRKNKQGLLQFDPHDIKKIVAQTKEDASLLQ